jgi:hypothetical protein
VVVECVEHTREALYLQRLVCGYRRFILLNSFLYYSLPQCLWSGFPEQMLFSLPAWIGLREGRKTYVKSLFLNFRAPCLSGVLLRSCVCSVVTLCSPSLRTHKITPLPPILLRKPPSKSWACPTYLSPCGTLVGKQRGLGPHINTLSNPLTFYNIFSYKHIFTLYNQLTKSSTEPYT